LWSNIMSKDTLDLMLKFYGNGINKNLNAVS